MKNPQDHIWLERKEFGHSVSQNKSNHHPHLHKRFLYVVNGQETILKNMLKEGGYLALNLHRILNGQVARKTEKQSLYYGPKNKKKKLRVCATNSKQNDINSFTHHDIPYPRVIPLEKK